MDQILLLTVGLAFATLVAVVLWARRKPPSDRTPASFKGAVAACLIGSAWAYGVVPNYLSVSETGRTPSLTSTAQAISGTGQIMGQLFLFLVALFAIVLVFLTLRDRVATSFGILTLLLAPFITLTTSGIVNNGGYSAFALILPLVVFALWRANLPIESLAPIAWLTILLAVFSIAIGINSPEIGTIDPPIEGGKISWTSLLAGPHSHPNVLGLALSLGIPFMPLIKRKKIRILGLLAVVSALAWTGNRNSIFAAAVVIALWAVLSKIKGMRIIALTASIGGALVVLTPILSKDPSDYSSRGRIWASSLRRLDEHPLLGQGPRFYQLIARYRNDLGPSAFSGHNALVHIAITGGLVTVAILLLIMIALVIKSIKLRSSTLVPALFAIGLIFNSWLQNPATISGIDIMGYAYIIPLAVILFTSTNETTENQTFEHRSMETIGR